MRMRKKGKAVIRMKKKGGKIKIFIRVKGKVGKVDANTRKWVTRTNWGARRGGGENKQTHKHTNSKNTSNKKHCCVSSKFFERNVKNGKSFDKNARAEVI